MRDTWRLDARESELLTKMRECSSLFFVNDEPGTETRFSSITVNTTLNCFAEKGNNFSQGQGRFSQGDTMPKTHAEPAKIALLKIQTLEIIKQSNHTGRTLLSTEELGAIFQLKPASIRRSLCANGHWSGLVPVKCANRLLLWPVSEV